MSQAYDLFCQEQETAIATMIKKYRRLPEDPVSQTVQLDRLGLHMACLSFAGKIFTEKIIFLRVRRAYNHRNEGVDDV